jgi:hypothetical protein
MNGDGRLDRGKRTERSSRRRPACFPRSTTRRLRVPHASAHQLAATLPALHAPTPARAHVQAVPFLARTHSQAQASSDDDRSETVAATGRRANHEAGRGGGRARAVGYGRRVTHTLRRWRWRVATLEERSWSRTTSECADRGQLIGMFVGCRSRGLTVRAQSGRAPID